MKTYLEQKRTTVDKALHQVFANREDCPPRLWQSMKYSVFAGGKRLRPILCLASAEAVGLPEKLALRIACSLELIHTYSLIHDDLPALDNDDYRRGRRTNHKVFGDAMAILAGDGLQTLAFEWLSNPLSYPKSYRRNLPSVIHLLARCAGFPGMVGGQVDDLLSEKKKPTLPKVKSIHSRKTGNLLMASVVLPGLLKDAPISRQADLMEYGLLAGLAFQVVDDILNATGNSKKMGKAAGSDKARGKMTYPAALGLEASQREVVRLTRKALDALEPFGRKGIALREVALYMAERTN